MQKSNEFEEYRKFTTALAKKAGNFIYGRFGKIKEIEEKTFKDYVTDVDKKSEKIIVAAIKKKFPGHQILAEEGGEIGKKSDYLWVIDPLDGTHNYIAQLPIYGVSIALSFKGEVVVGVLYFPFFKELYEAEKGKGAYLNGKKIGVFPRPLQESIVFFDSAFQKERERKLRDFRAVSRGVSKIRTLGCLSFQLAYIACGKAGGCIGWTGKPWDYAAGTLLVQEAGGRVTDFKGRLYSLKDTYVVATSGKVHGQLLNLLNK